MDRNLALEAVRVTEAAALAASKLMGRGDEKMADQAAVDAMRTTLNSLAIEGTVVIGEGERDEAPMLYIGEKVGGGGPKIDIALDPLEGTTITAKGLPNALAVMAMAEHGGFLNAPDVYMDKIAVGGGLPDGIVDLDKTPKQNLADLAKAKKIDVADLVVCILDRPRHSELIAKVREAGARIMLIGDGDVSGVIATSTGNSGIDIYMGSGGAPEGVLAAAALRCHRRPDPGPPAVPQRRREGARAQVGHHRPQPQILDDRHGQGRRDVRGDRRHLGLDAEGRAPLPQRRRDAFDRDALEDRHGALDFRPSQFHDQDWFAELGVIMMAGCARS